LTTSGNPDPRLSHCIDRVDPAWPHAMTAAKSTTVGTIDEDILRFTAGEDLVLDRRLVEADCLGSAAHARMLAEMPLRPPILTRAEAAAVARELRAIVVEHRAGRFVIRPEDQDVHLAVERTLTERLGDLGKRIHTGRSRNDQVAVDLRLWAREELLALVLEATALAGALLDLGRRHRATPMVGRTHMQPAMPSSVGLWATSFTEALLDDLELVETAYTLNDRCPLGAAAGYGVPLPLDRRLTSRLLGFSRPVHNTSHAINARGKLESIILQACGQVMGTLSRLAQDLMLYTLPEFGYFALPPAFTTGSSIMPNKRNPDVMELVRARAATVSAHAQCAALIVHAAPTGYNRDLQDAKGPFMAGLDITRATLRVFTRCVEGLQVKADRLLAAFTPEVFATDEALRRVAAGVPFRDAYHQIKAGLSSLHLADPRAALREKTHLGATHGLDFDGYRTALAAHRRRASARLTRLAAVRRRLLDL
jgi:argininosuccinate lyase